MFLPQKMRGKSCCVFEAIENATSQFAANLNGDHLRLGALPPSHWPIRVEHAALPPHYTPQLARNVRRQRRQHLQPTHESTACATHVQHFTHERVLALTCSSTRAHAARASGEGHDDGSVSALVSFMSSAIALLKRRCSMSWVAALIHALVVARRRVS